MMIVRVSDGQSLDKEFMYVLPEFQNLNLAVFWVYSSVPNRRLSLISVQQRKKVKKKISVQGNFSNKQASQIGDKDWKKSRKRVNIQSCLFGTPE